jgi:FtsP/CotA-like multicopper oxidase with cupredoxin domain
VLKKLTINVMLLLGATTSLLLPGSLSAISAASSTVYPSTSIQEYDKIKNCTTELSKHPTSIQYLTYFNCGHISIDTKGRTIRDFTLIIQENQKIPVSNEGHIFDGWTFNGTIPGPTMRVTQGDHVRIKVINDAGNQHAHSLHLHSIHSAVMDGVSMGGYVGGAIPPGGSFVYEFTAQPYGVFPYHCHVDPIADHINRGLYGMFIIDPKTPRQQMTEFAMLMNGYDMNFDQEGPVTIPTVEESNSDQQSGKSDESQDKFSSSDNKKLKETTEVQKNDVKDGPSAEADDVERDNEIYTVNGKAFDYMTHPIAIQAGKPYRIYLVNMLEFDLVNSFHMHGAMYNYTIAGTEEKPNYTTDLVTLAQGDRGIIEFKMDYPGQYMFHAHQTEFTDLGWMGMFSVKPNTT